MKKLLLITVAAILSLTALSQNIYKISGASFNTTNSVLSGSEQWIDVKCDLPYPSSFTVYCLSSINLDSIASTNLLIYESSFYFENLPSNLDSSKRIYFNVPWDLHSGYFAIITNLVNQGVVLGKVTYATSLPELTTTPTQTKYTYTNLLGQQTTNLKGLLICSDKKLIFFE
jgi:hypothetical protein